MERRQNNIFTQQWKKKKKLIMISFEVQAVGSPPYPDASLLLWVKLPAMAFDPRGLGCVEATFQEVSESQQEVISQEVSVPQQGVLPSPNCCFLISLLEEYHL
jgi:hypothetical protein